MSGRSLVFGTLGPAGSNHDFVTRRYTEAHRLENAKIIYFQSFELAIQAMIDGDIDHVVQVAVHPDVPASVGGNLGVAHLIDAFVAASQPMAILTRRDIERPVTLCLMPATRAYVDVSSWPEVIAAANTIDVWGALKAGRCDSGLTLTRFVEDAPDRFRIDRSIGAVTDAWLVYGREPLPEASMSIWPESAAAHMLRRSAKGLPR